MPTYMDVHDGFVGVTQEQFEEAHRRDLAIQAEEDVSYDHAWLDPESGKAFCLATGPNKEAVIRIHERAGHPTSLVYEVPIAV